MKFSRMLQVAVSALAAVASIGVMSRVTFAQAADPFVGTWKLNVARSTFKAGPAPRSGTATFSTVGPAVMAVVDGVAANGDKTHWTYTASADGKDYPAVGNADADTVSLKKIDARTVEITYHKGGKVTLVNRRTVAADGKTMTVTTKGTNAKGEAIDRVQVYDKV
jgi:hypothetical protein